VRSLAPTHPPTAPLRTPRGRGPGAPAAGGGDRFEREAQVVAARAAVGAMVPGGLPVKVTPFQGPRMGGSASPSSPPAGLGAGAPLPVGVRADLEARLGHDFRRVRIHADARGARAADATGARAVTVGRHIAFARGEFAPGNVEVLAHELTHVLQQSTGGHRGVQRCGRGPRLAEIGIRRDPLQRQVIVFSEIVDRDRAIELMWRGAFRPALEVFRPDHEDPWADRSRGCYQRWIFDYGNPIGRPTWREMWDSMRPAIRREYSGAYEETPRVGERTGEPLFPSWVPERLRTSILEGTGLRTLESGSGVQVGVAASARGHRWPLLVWRRVTPPGDIQFALEGLWPGDLAYYRGLGVDDGTARLLRRALTGWNADMTELVLDQGIHPRRARQIVAQRDRVKMVIALLELYSMMIPARFGPAPRGGVTTGERGLIRESRRIVREMRASGGGGGGGRGGGSSVPPERGSTIPASPSRAPTVPAGRPSRAPTLPAPSPSRAPTLPAGSPSRAPTVPAGTPSRAPTVPVEHPSVPRPTPPSPRRTPARTPEPGPPEPLPGSERPAIPPPPPVHPVRLPDIPPPGRTPTLRGMGPPRAHRGGPSRPPGPRTPRDHRSRSSPTPPVRDYPDGATFQHLTLEQARQLSRAYAGRSRIFFGSRPDGRLVYREMWTRSGDGGPLPPFGFVVRDAAGQVLDIVFYWPTASSIPL
jgi:hypothetical protein